MLLPACLCNTLQKRQHFMYSHLLIYCRLNNYANQSTYQKLVGIMIQIYTGLAQSMLAAWSCRCSPACSLLCVCLSGLSVIGVTSGCCIPATALQRPVRAFANAAAVPHLHQPSWHVYADCVSWSAYAVAVGCHCDRVTAAFMFHWRQVQVCNRITATTQAVHLSHTDQDLPAHNACC